MRKLFGFVASVALIAHAAVGADPRVKGDDLLRPKPRPARAPLAPSRLPLEFINGERIAFVGGSVAERMNLFGHFETFLHTEIVLTAVNRFGQTSPGAGPAILKKR